MVFLNGNIVPDTEAKVSVFDRSFCYGDGLFETVPVWAGAFFRWRQHWQRLETGAAALGIEIPFPEDQLRSAGLELVQRNIGTAGLLRVQLSRGAGVRGYSPAGAKQPVVVMTAHAAPKLSREPVPGWNLVTSSIRLPLRDVLSPVKSCNKLRQVLARTEAEGKGADEALLLNMLGDVAEGTGSNLFWIEQQAVKTPPLASGALEGVTRSVVLELCRRLGVDATEERCLPSRLGEANGVFLTLSSYGIVAGRSLDGRQLLACPLTGELQRAYLDLLDKECPERRIGSSCKG